MNQNNAPLFTAVRQYKEKKPAYFCIPGHRFARGIAPEWVADVGEQIFGYDLTEAHGLDDLHAPEGAILEAQKLTAELYGADRSWFLINGTTCGNEAMLLATLSPGDKVLLPRNAHKSMLMGLVLSGATPVWMMPEYIEHLQIFGGIRPETVEKALTEDPSIRAVCLVSPNYYGMLCDVKKIAAICHARQIPLLVDEAHGAHLYFSDALPVGALACGADLCVQSWHKVTGALGQSSVLQMHSSLVSEAAVDAALKLVQSTSPSYLLMTSLDLARRELARAGSKQLTQLQQTADHLREQIRKIPGLDCPGKELVGRYGIYALDESRLTIDVSQLSLTGQEFSDQLFSRFGVDLELAEEKVVLAILTAANTTKDTQRLLHALHALATDTPTTVSADTDVQTDAVLPALPPAVLPPRQAWFAKKAVLPWKNARGHISAEAVIPYPPGIPVLCPGEKITDDIWQHIEHLRQQGCHFHGPQDLSLDNIQVIL